MVKYSLYLWRVFTSDRVYLWPLMSISHISLIAAILWRDRHRCGLSPQSIQVIQAFKRIVLDPIKITSASCMSVRESSAEAPAQVIRHWFVELSYSVCGKWLCLSLLCSAAKLKMVAVGNSARDLGSGGYLWLCVNNIVEQKMAYHASLYSCFSLQKDCWAPQRAQQHPVCS